jgi:hypothetical protein
MPVSTRCSPHCIAKSRILWAAATSLMVHVTFVVAAGTTTVASTSITTAPIAVRAAATGYKFGIAAYFVAAAVNIQFVCFAVAAATAFVAAAAHTDVITKSSLPQS